MLAAGGEGVGPIGYGEREWRHETVRETGWGALPEFQVRGVAARAARELVEAVRRTPGEGGHPTPHAFPDADRAASHGVCREAGFTLLGQVGFGCPKGTVSSGDRYVDLRTGPTE